MTLKKMASEIAKREGLRSQARIYDIAEVLGIVSDLLFENPDLVEMLVSNGTRRAKRKKNAAKK